LVTRVLVVGGTGPTGPHVVRGLLDRGHDVTIFHRGTHELPELADVEHLHGDPHFRGPIEEALGSHTFDLVVATTATHCVLSTEKARRELGYQPAVDPVEALREVLAWYAARPAYDPAGSPSFTDRFDYQAEDALIAGYRAAVRRVTFAVEQRPAPPVHSMPHPASPGMVDHRGR
jgi:nucleoside-diphosphate-sugar epimerase